MAANKLVGFIQSRYPPPGRLPDRGDPGGDFDQLQEWEPEGLLINALPIPRSPIPEWLQPGTGAEFPVSGELVLESEGLLAEQPGYPDPIDVLAYYLPFHFYRDEWGIYVRASGILSVASMVRAAIPSSPHSTLLRLASQILFEHERFHFFSEIACSRAEVVSAVELYRRYFLDKRAATLEEALCNAHSVRATLSGEPPPLRTAVENWMLAQGPGYRDFRSWTSPSRFTRGRQIAIGRMLIPVLRASAHEPTEFLFAGSPRLTAPTYMVLDAAGTSILRPFPKYAGLRVLVHTNDHPPPHFHVQIPPGRDFTRLEWPTRQPLRGDPALSGRDRRSLDEYLSKYGPQIEAKIREVYRSAA